MSEHKIKYSNAIVFIVVAFFAMGIFATDNKQPLPEYNPQIMFFNSTGRIPKPGKIWMETIPITTANGQVVDISAAGFTSISSINIAGAANTTTITSMPNCVVKSNTLTTVTFNTTVSNSAVLAILQGLVFPASTTGMTASVTVIGN